MNADSESLEIATTSDALDKSPHWENRASMLAFMQFNPRFKLARNIVGSMLIVGVVCYPLTALLIALSTVYVPVAAIFILPVVWAFFSSLTGWFNLYQRRQALHHGKMVRGLITRVRSNKLPALKYRSPSPATRYEVQVSYKDFEGRERQDSEYLAWSEETLGPLPIEQGDVVMLKVDRRNPRVAVIPTLYGQRASTVSDTRRMLPAPAPSSSDLKHFSCALLDEDPTRRRPQRVGELALRDGVLTLKLEHGEPVVVDLNEPFALQLSAWLEGESRALAHVLLRPRGDGTDASAALRFSVPLTQAEVDTRVTLRQTFLPVMTRQSFEALWPVLVDHLRAHGDSAWTQLQLTTTAA